MLYYITEGMNLCIFCMCCVLNINNIWRFKFPCIEQEIMVEFREESWVIRGFHIGVVEVSGSLGCDTVLGV